MKKILLGTTAVIALGAISTEAFAADKIKLELGGFMRHYVGVISDDEASNTGTNNSDRAMSLSQDSNTEVYFSGSTTLDNGLTVKAQIELEGDGEEGGNSTDKSFLTISSDAMGALTMGVTAHASDDFDVNAPNAVGNFGYRDLDDWAQMAANNGNNEAFTFSALRDWNGDNSAKLKYVTPTFNGVKGFASYSAAEGSSASDADNLDRNTTADGSSFGIAYAGDVSGVAVKADLSQTRLNGVNNNVHFGLSVAMSGVTVGGSYVSTKDDDGTDNLAGDGKEYDLGVAYNTGPYTVSASYSWAKNDGTTGVSGDNKDRAWRVAGSYDLGAGVALSATYFNLKRDGEGDGATYVLGKSAQVSGVIAGIEVGF
ncbi:MAG: porin [Magnetovibrio sp.]|nr:porin [Magnetovibrio sp.]